MNTFEHQRHKVPTTLERPRELIVALPQLQSQVNLARIVRAAGCCGINRIEPVCVHDNPIDRAAAVLNTDEKHIAVPFGRAAGYR